MAKFQIFVFKKIAPKNKWLSLIAGIFLALVSGTSYLFETFGPYLKNLFGFTQSEINLTATLAGLGGYLSIPNGIILDLFGPQFCGILGSICLFAGYFLVWEATNHKVLTSNILLGLYLAISGFGAGGAYSSGLGSNIEKWSPRHRGIITGVLAAGFGLSGAIFAGIYQIFFHGNIQLFLLVLPILLGSIGAIASIFVIEDPIVESESSDTPETSPLIQKSVNSNTEGQSDYEISKSRVLGGGRDLNPLRMIIDYHFVLYFITFLIVSGSGLLVISNVGNIAESLGGESSSENYYVIALSLSNCAGRIIVGFLGDFLIKKFGWPRPVFVALAGFLMMISHLILAFSTIHFLYVGVVLTGISYGMLWGIHPLLTRELFGSTYWGTNFSLLGLAPGLGGYLLSALMAGKIYQQHAPHGSIKCLGQDCYQETFFITTGLNGFAVILVSLLSLLTRKWYFAGDHHTATKNAH